MKREYEQTRHDERVETRQLYETAVHEVRSALTAMRGWAHWLGRDYGASLGESGHAGLQKLEAGIERIHRVIEQLGDASPATALDLDVQALDPEPMLRRVSEDVKAALEAGNIQLRLGIMQGPVYADPGRLYAIVLNLVQNSIGHMSSETSSPCIFVDCVRDCRAGGAEIVVRDNAQGLPNLENLGIAELFRCGERPRAGTGGLTLAVVRRLAGAHGGSVDLEHDPEGVRFRVFLPDAAPRAHDSPLPTEPR